MFCYKCHYALVNLNYESNYASYILMGVQNIDMVLYWQ